MIMANRLLLVLALQAQLAPQARAQRPEKLPSRPPPAAASAPAAPPAPVEELPPLPPPPHAPDLSQLPLINDQDPPDEEPAPAGAPHNPGAPPPRTYLQPMVGDPHIDFVPAAPEGVADPRGMWDAMLSTPPKAPPARAAGSLRTGAVVLLPVGGAALLTSLFTLAPADAGPALQGVGYSSLAVGGISVGVATVLYLLSERRLHPRP